MKTNMLFFNLFIIFLLSKIYSTQATQHQIKIINKLSHLEGIVSLFTLTPEEIAINTPVYINQAKETISDIIAIAHNERTYGNTVEPLDELFGLSNLAIAQRVYYALKLVHPDAALRAAAHDACITIQAFWIDYIMSNKELYKAFIAYTEQQKEYEGLSAQQRYFLNDTIDCFKREGLALPEETLAEVNTLRKELAVLCADFDRNIAQDNSFITTTTEELEGLDNDFISALRTTEEGHYIVGVDYPTYFSIMESCSVAETRKKLYIAFSNRAYPINEEILKKIIEKREGLAHLLGYTDYASSSISSQMAENPTRVQAFLEEMIQPALKKGAKEIALLTEILPKSVVLTPEGKIQAWDFAYLKNEYKKAHFNLDEQKIAEYFPMQNTIKELLDIYHQFFGIDFEEIQTTGLWHEDVKVIRVLQNKNIIGTLMLDLHPRPNKYTHAMYTPVVPSTYTAEGVRIPNVSIVIANFSKPTSTQPALLHRSEVSTFFHELGHALHGILGATEIASLSGTNTKTDFVELPSQLLEEWLSDKTILQKISKHYKTGEHLPDKVIDSIIALKNLTSGYYVMEQVYLSNLSLSYFGPDKEKDPHTIMKQLRTKFMPYTDFSLCNNHRYASFGHLTGYEAKYYGYLWSYVFALDLFANIKKHGLLNPEIGKKYVKEVLSKGGAQDPNELLYNFLGREPNSHAFFEEMGL